MSRPVVLVLVLVVLGGAYAFVTRREHPSAVASASMGLDDIHRKVAADAIAQYGIAKRNGSKADVCAAAMQVKAAELQAADENAYAEWSKIAIGACGVSP